jgi:hypothetical protein
MKKCKHCKQIITEKDYRLQYCKSCRDAGWQKRDNNKRMRVKRINQKKRGKIKNYNIGNPSQDDKIMRFLQDI